jgi:hypothetical protein
VPDPQSSLGELGGVQFVSPRRMLLLWPTVFHRQSVPPCHFRDAEMIPPGHRAAPTPPHRREAPVSLEVCGSTCSVISQVRCTKYYQSYQAQRGTTICLREARWGLHSLQDFNVNTTQQNVSFVTLSLRYALKPQQTLAPESGYPRSPMTLCRSGKRTAQKTPLQ